MVQTSVQKAQWTRRTMMTPRGRAMRMWLSTRSRCAREGVEFTLTVEHIAVAIERGTCPKTGAQFDLYWPEVGAPRLGSRVNSFSPSLDRKDGTKGYTDDNVQIVAWWYNCAKGEISELELQQWCRQVLATAKKK